MSDEKDCRQQVTRPNQATDGLVAQCSSGYVSDDVDTFNLVPKVGWRDSGNEVATLSVSLHMHVTLVTMPLLPVLSCAQFRHG